MPRGGGGAGRGVDRDADQPTAKADKEKLRTETRKEIPMKITAVTKFKHSLIYNALGGLGWSQADLARKSGLSVRVISLITTLQRRPSEQEANAIQLALAVAGKYIDVLEGWPETFKLERGAKNERTEDIRIETLAGNKEALTIEYESADDTSDIDAALDGELRSLGGQHEKAIRAVFLEGDTLEVASKKLGVSRSRVQQLTAYGLRILRRPLRIENLIKSLPAAYGGIDL